MENPKKLSKRNLAQTVQQLNTATVNVRHLDSDYYVYNSEESEVEKKNWLPEEENHRDDNEVGLVKRK